MALRALVARIAVASAVVAVPVIEAVVLAHMERAVKPDEPLFAHARLVVAAGSVARALIWAVAGLTRCAEVARLAQTEAVLADTAAVAVHGAGMGLTGGADEAGRTTAHSIDTHTTTATI